MALNEEIFNNMLRQSIEFDSTGWETPEDVNRWSLERLWANGSHARTLKSKGMIRISGQGTLFGEALLTEAANILLNLQNLVTVMGASLEGIKTKTRSALPQRILDATSLKINLKPQRGSLVLRFSPAISPVDELSEEEFAMFGQNRTQFIDICMASTMEILNAAHATQADMDSSTFLDLITNGGPIVASALKRFASELDKDSYNINLEWTQPEVQTVRILFTAADAKFVKSLIISRQLDEDDTELVGRLVTLSSSANTKWLLEDSLGSQVTLDTSQLPPGFDVSQFHLKQNIKVLATPIVKTQFGGSASVTYRVISMEIEPSEPA